MCIESTLEDAQGSEVVPQNPNFAIADIQNASFSLADQSASRPGSRPDLRSEFDTQFFGAHDSGAKATDKLILLQNPIVHV